MTGSKLPGRPPALVKLPGRPPALVAAKACDPPTSAASWERVEGVSRSLPNSDLLTLTSSHVFLSVMN